ncbi:hypothetical protein [Leptolyngbya sp. FACHB-711]|uniref:hypothetical protein n=1 Tax=unclassified Leptolyngbya TaxID=2650499 RepID=UPI0016838ADA|nr:hypothetical protein [Leptolyngbya sp. FACHB-711]MBD1850256.1 hypothetical protein [Cyanobacteria bacterium FACHB-502]MBD2025622.1 hypothetical protein [Leptolyngbya sp. FACHB-711]
MNDSKALFDYWYEQVRLKNHELVQVAGHVETYKLRHECTNYDELRLSREVQLLEEPERSKVIAIIKYECTAKVLQYRAGRLRDRANQLSETCGELETQKTKLLRLIQALQAKLFGKDKELEQYKARIAILEAENAALQADAENSQAEVQLRTELEKLQKQYDAVEKRRRELAQNNKSLGGRVAHTQRYKRQRDEAMIQVKELRAQLQSLTHENQQLRAENDRLRLALNRVENQAAL